MFYSILFPNKEKSEEKRCSDEPECFKDLNLNQIFAPLLEAKAEFELNGFFYTSLHDPAVIVYRQDVMRELENRELCKLFSDFSGSVYTIDRKMDKLREALSSDNDWENNYLSKGRLLDYADRYCAAVSTLTEGLSAFKLRSAGLRGFCEYLFSYCRSDHYISLREHIKHLRAGFSEVKYCMLINKGTVRVRRFEEQADHSEQILSCFEKFRQGDVQNYQRRLSEEPSAEHIEADVLNLLSKLYKDLFSELDTFCSEYFRFDDEIILRFSREIQFYLSWFEYIRPLREAGLPMCYPEICEKADNIYILDGYDIVLASMLSRKTVINDFRIEKPKQIIVVTGPNQGGKTTYARAFGQIHYLGMLGLCVPGREAALYLFDRIYTHFEREENLAALSGKLQDDLIRLHDLLGRATSKSIIIINEIFSSTTLTDALVLGGHMMDAISALGAPAVIVTFLDELACYNEKTISMMSTVDEEDPSSRTFKIIPKPPDGLAYAMYIARRHGLTYEQLCGRLKK